MYSMDLRIQILYEYLQLMQNRRQCIAIRVIMLVFYQRQVADAWLVSRDISFS